ncbi:MAG: EAL domain-containing protein [Candidatus Dormiibacterota bacterium]
MAAPIGRGAGDRLTHLEIAPREAAGKHPATQHASADSSRTDQKTHRHAAPSRRSDAGSSSLSEQELLRATVTKSPIALTVVDVDGTALLWNPAAERIFGWTASEVIGKPLTIIDASSRDEFDRLRNGSVEGIDVLDFDVRRLHRDGHLVDAAISTVALVDPHGSVTAVLAAYQDITGRKVAEAELVRQAHEDELTCLLNRRGLLEQLLHLRELGRRRVSVLVMDIDRFKSVNDSFGRTVGDQVLSAFAKQLSKSVRARDVVARLEGATFAVLMVGVLPGDLEATVERLLGAVSQRYGLTGHETAVKVTSGVARCSLHVEPAEIVRRAEVAMHYAKQVSRGGFQVLDEALDRTFQEQGQLSARLLDAAERGELRLHFQPIISAVSGRLSGVEALVRWEHPDRGLLGPNEFIHLAEENGSISAIGRWVLLEACATLKHWTDSFPAAAEISVSVNVSVAQLQDGSVVKDVEEALARSELAPGRLHLEVTESVLSTEPEAAARALGQLRLLGVCLVIDDFGTGNSSLTALQRFPFSVLKIDRSFVSGLGNRSEDAIVSATLALAHGLGLSVVAEGVETAAQAEFLAAGGCEEFQGFLFSRPVRASLIEPMLNGSSLPLGAGNPAT